MASLQRLLAVLHLATLADAMRRSSTTYTRTKTTAKATKADARPVAAEPPAPIPCGAEGTSSDAGIPDRSQPTTATAADAPRASKAGWFVRAFSAVKAKWRAVAIAAADKATPAPEEPATAPAPRAASATSTASQSDATQAVAPAPGNCASAPTAPKPATWFARAFATAEAKCGSACHSVAASWHAAAAQASAALTPKRKAEKTATQTKGRRSSKAHAALSPSAPAGAAVAAPAAGPGDNASPALPVADADVDAAVLVSVVTSPAPKPAAAAPTPGSEAGAAATPSRWRDNLCTKFRSALPHALASRRAPASSPEARIKAGAAPSAKPCDGEPAPAPAAPKGHIGQMAGAAFAAKLARLSARRSRPDWEAAKVVVGVVGGEAAVAC